MRTGERETAETSTLFVYIGAAPQTAWLEGAVLLDAKGFVLAGRELQGARRLRVGAGAPR